METMKIIGLLLIIIFMYILPIWLFFYEETILSWTRSATNRIPIISHYMTNTIGVSFIIALLVKICVLPIAIVLSIIVVCVQVWILVKIPNWAYEFVEKKREQQEREKEKEKTK